MAQAIFGLIIFMGGLFIICKGLSLIGRYCGLSDLMELLGDSFAMRGGILPDNRED